jgi:hypothetical protein
MNNSKKQFSLPLLLTVIFSFLIIFSFPSHASACGVGTYNVGSGQTYTTINAAISAVASDCGSTAWNQSNTIHVFSGTYNEIVYVLNNLGTSINNRLVIQLDSGAILDGQGSRNFGMEIDTNHVTVQGSGKITRYANNAIYQESQVDLIIAGDADPRGGASTLEIASNVSGIVSQFSSGLLIYNIYAHDQSGSYSLWDNSSLGGSCQMYQNKLENNLGAADMYGASEACTIHDSLMLNNTGSGGVAFDGGNGGIAYNNISINSRYAMLSLGGATNSLFYNNLNIGGLFCGTWHTASGAIYYNNICYGQTIHVWDSDLATATLKNNITYITQNNIITYLCGTTCNGVTADYNDIYVAAGVTGVVGAQYNSGNHTLAEFTAATGQDTHSITTNPQFTNPGGTNASDYKWPSSSSLKDAGTTIGSVLTDYFGTTRPQGSAYDIGFYEFPVATTFTLTGPSSGNAGSASTNFTVTPNGLYTGTITLTPTGSGSTGLSATVLTFSSSLVAQTFTITPTVAGSITLTSTNNGSVINPGNLTYTVNAIIPGVPTIGTATASNGSATVTFTAPASNGGATITSYTATSNPGNITGTLTQAGSGTIVVSSLTNGTPYTFTVTATNVVGTSSASAASNSVTPIAPSAPILIISSGGGYRIPQAISTPSVVVTPAPSTTPPPPTTTTTTPPLFPTPITPTSTHTSITTLQSFLNTTVPNTHLPLNGKFGPQTKAALKKFQRLHHLTPDGVMGKKTREVMEGILKL